MDYAVLKGELGLPAYTGLSDQAAANSLNLKNIPTLRFLTAAENAVYLAENPNMWDALDLASKIVLVTDPKYPARKSAVIAMESRLYGLDLANSKVVALVNQLASLAVITGPQKDAWVALGTVQISKATQLGLGTVTVRDIQIAKGTI